VILFFISDSEAEILNKIPEVNTASQGLALIRKDSFGGIELARLLEQKDSIDASGREFSSEMGDGVHYVGLTESFGRVTLVYHIMIEPTTPKPETVFDLDGELFIDYFSNLGVGELVRFAKEYKWKWKSGDFSCEALYNFWTSDRLSFSYKCFSLN
jgi:hypothetical protein